jgi:hypothetical protein
VNLPCSAIIESIVYNDHWTLKEAIKSRWLKKANAVLELNSLSDGLGVYNVDTDILYCYPYYVEPKFAYEAQLAYWKK